MLKPGKESSEKTMAYVVGAIAVVLAVLSNAGIIDATPESANAWLMGLQESAKNWFAMLMPWITGVWAVYATYRTWLKGKELDAQAKVAGGQKPAEG